MVDATGIRPAPAAQLPVDGERFLPDFMHGEIELEHLHRYRFASQFVADKQVLDIASGEGYGSALLAQLARKVIGVDVDQRAIGHARSKYGVANLEFRVGSCAQIPLEDKSVDVVVSFETIEHHTEHEAMMAEIKRVLRPGGLLVISSPDRLTYSDKPNFHNPFHVKELYRDEFETLLGAHFKRFRVHGQRILFGSSIFAGTDRGKVAFQTLRSEGVNLGQPADPVYLVALASDGKLPAVSGSLLEGKPAHTSDAGGTLGVPLLTRAIKLLAPRESAALSAALSDPWYLGRNVDLADAKIDPVQHWWSSGADEGRMPAANMPALVAAILAERETAARSAASDERDRAADRERAIAEQLTEIARQFTVEAEAARQSHAEREAAVKHQIEQLLRDVAKEHERQHQLALELVAERSRLQAELFTVLNTQAERERNSAQALSNLQQEIDADRLGIAAKLESAIAPLRQAQAYEAEAAAQERERQHRLGLELVAERSRLQTELFVVLNTQAERERNSAQALSSLQQEIEADRLGASGELQAFRAEVQNWRDSSVTPWIEEQRRTIELLAQRLAAEAQANGEWRAVAEQDRKLTERNALSQFRANRVLSDQLSSVQAQIEADRQHAESVDLKALDREQRLVGQLEQVRDFQGRTHRLLTEQLPELRVQIGSEAAQAAEREQRLLSRLEDRFAAEAESQRALTEQLSTLRVQIGSEAAQAGVRERHLLSRLEDRFAAETESQRVLTEQLSTLRVQIGSEAAQAAEREQRLLSRLEDRFAAQAESQRVLTEQQCRLGTALQVDRQRASEQALTLTRQLSEATAWRRRHLKLVAASSAALADLRSTWTWRTTGPIRALVDQLADAASVDRGRSGIDTASTSLNADSASISVQSAGSLAELLAHEGGAFVACAYMTLLRRPPDAVGYPHYLARLSVEADKVAILRALFESEEGRRQKPKLPGLRRILLRHRMKSWPGLRLLARHRRLQRRVNQLLLELGTVQEDEDALPEPSSLQPLAEDSTADGEIRGSFDARRPLAASALDVEVGSVEAANESTEAVDPAWYLSVYGDVAAAGVDPNEHYRVHGRADGRLPNPMALLHSLIDVEKYLEAEPELARLGVDPIQHYLNTGYHENRTTGVSLTLLQFDPDWYLKHNPDVQVAGVDPLRHFASQGFLQIRSWSSFRGLDKIAPEALSYFEPLNGLEAKLIAFYLPQYHPIPENDEWWGKGFTEWSNVSRARPLYKNHDQPRLPGELGFYDLRLADNMKRQAELARIHGIHAFCFYVYWFGGKRLLERPVDEFLRQPDIDINFCLCWANENWTRRWDGLDADVLIGQSHSPEDDLAFIAEMSRAFADPRYVRVDGKPVLVVYRPEQLPNSHATTDRWRQWCRDNGIGEIHLCFIKSFGSNAPAALGMDAAIEFPPLLTGTQEITGNVEGLDPAFRGQVHNYLFTASRAADYVRPNHLEYRGVMPSWDNTPRKLERSISFYGATPELYAEWLRSAVDETCRSLAPENRLVFINAWNEWAEGAYLEPDRRRGYAYLSRTREVMAGFSSSMVADSELLAKGGATARVAIIVHLHYSDLLEHIASYLHNVPEAVDLYISVREGAFKQVRRAVKSRFPTATVVSYPNHGRDVVPFLRILTHIRGFGYEAIGKIHSKKSRHRDDGDRWRDDVLDQLLGSASRIEACLNLIRAGNGVVAPAGHLLSGATYWGSNARRVTELALQMQCPHEWIQDFVFPAGTMFWFQPGAMEPLLDLGLQPADFEREAGQVDGTTAHAVERLIGLSARKAGLSVVATPDGTADGAYPFAASTSADGKRLEAKSSCR
jgi:lipopolysaccharide biosynthesis protein/SAM-dependent methyltransferase